MPENGGLEKTGDDVAADMEITIKSTSEAFKVFTGMTGIAQTYAAHGFFVKGNPYDTMGLVHGLELAEAYLFPKILARRILARVPSKRCSVGIVYHLKPAIVQKVYTHRFRPLRNRGVEGAIRQLVAAIRKFENIHITIYEGILREVARIALSEITSL